MPEIKTSSGVSDPPKENSTSLSPLRTLRKRPHLHLDRNNEEAARSVINSPNPKKSGNARRKQANHLSGALHFSANSVGSGTMSYFTNSGGEVRTEKPSVSRRATCDDDDTDGVNTSKESASEESSSMVGTPRDGREAGKGQISSPDAISNPSPVQSLSPSTPDRSHSLSHNSIGNISNSNMLMMMMNNSRESDNAGEQEKEGVMIASVGYNNNNNNNTNCNKQSHSMRRIAAAESHLAESAAAAGQPHSVAVAGASSSSIDSYLSEEDGRRAEERVEDEYSYSFDGGDVDCDEAFLAQEFDPYLFIYQLPPLAAHHMGRPFCIPAKPRDAPKVTLVLDLDETLVHCATQPIADAEVTFPVVYNKVEYTVYVRTRPFLKEFFQAISEDFEIVIFTASHSVYADTLLDIIDPGRVWSKHRVFRESCIHVEGNYLKELSVLGRDLSTVVIVDNSPHAFAYQLANGVPIISWFDDINDRELLKLVPFLKKIADVEDVRPYIVQTFRMEERVRYAASRFASIMNRGHM